MPLLAKICGLKRPKDVEVSIRLGADLLGFIVEAPSPRRLSVKEAAAVAATAEGVIPRVAVTVNARDALFAAIMKDMSPDYIQFHGGETPQRIAEVSSAHPHVGIIKAMPVSTPSDMLAAQEFYDVADIMLFDAKPPKGADVRGGHGVAFDWEILNAAHMPSSFALAGGLNPTTVRSAIAATQAHIFDVSSGVERSPGVKDAQMIKRFIDTVHTGCPQRRPQTA